MYRVVKTMEVAASHSLHFSKADVWEPLHGHNWKITVWCQSAVLDEDGMVVDFLEIERRIHDFLDHGDLNELLPFNPTAENVARWVCEQIPTCFQVEVRESENDIAVYYK